MERHLRQTVYNKSLLLLKSERKKQGSEVLTAIITGLPGSPRLSRHKAISCLQKATGATLGTALLSAGVPLHPLLISWVFSSGASALTLWNHVFVLQDYELFLMSYSFKKAEIRQQLLQQSQFSQSAQLQKNDSTSH